MLFGFFYYDWTILIVLPALIFTFWAQISVNSRFNKYSQMRTSRGLTGAEAARRILDENGLKNVRIERVHGSTAKSKLCSEHIAQCARPTAT